MTFGAVTQMGFRNHVLDGSVRWRYLANTIERSAAVPDIGRHHVQVQQCMQMRLLMHSIVTLNFPHANSAPCDAAFCQNSLTTCYYYEEMMCKEYYISDLDTRMNSAK